jgi:hypothetical protein
MRHKTRIASKPSKKVKLPALRLKAPRAIRFDAKLKHLPAKLQAEIYCHLRKTKTKDVIQWLADTHHINISPTTLAVFYRWYPIACHLGLVRLGSDTYLDGLIENPNLVKDGRLASDMAQLEFERLVRLEQETANFIKLRELRLVEEAGNRRAAFDEEKLKLALRRQNLAEKKAAQSQAAEKPTLTPEETDQKIKELWGLK